MVKKVFFDFFFLARFKLSLKIRSVDKKSSYVDKKDTSIAGLRMFVAFLVGSAERYTVGGSGFKYGLRGSHNTF